MTGSSLSTLTPGGTGRRAALVAAARRYALAALGPFTIAGAHFAGSLLFLKLMPAAAFGLFAFVLVAVPFWLGLSVALLGAPLATTRQRDASEDWRELPTLMKANLVFCVVAGAAVAVAMAASGADAACALLFGLYGAVMCLRWFARWLFYAAHKPMQAVASDVAYGVVLTAGLATLVPAGLMSVGGAAAVLCVAAAAGLVPFGTDFFKSQLRALHDGSLRAYGPIWRELTQWALLGVVTSELSVNAHAYLVTFFAGPKAFALIAAGSLFMRPVSLCLTALPDRERPLMVRTLNDRDLAGAERCVRDFRGAATAVWAITLGLAAIVLSFWPQAILKPEYNRHDIVVVLALWSAIMAIRAWRTPDAVLLQAAREFKALSGASVLSSVVALGATAALLFAFGPVASLGGILIGDIVLTERVFALSRRWKRGFEGAAAATA